MQIMILTEALRQSSRIFASTHKALNFKGIPKKWNTFLCTLRYMFLINENF